MIVLVCEIKLHHIVTVPSPGTAAAASPPEVEGGTLWKIPRTDSSWCSGGSILFNATNFGRIMSASNKW